MRLEDLNETLNRLRDWIDNADTKTSVLIATLAIALGFTAPEVKDTKDILVRSGASVSIVLFLGVWIFYLSNLAYSLYHSLRAITPHPESLELRTVNGRPIVTDFPNIGRLGLDEYIKAVEDTDEEQLRRELTRLCHHFGQIADHKFKHFIKAMSAFRIALITQLIIFVWITIVLPGGP